MVLLIPRRVPLIALSFVTNKSTQRLLLGLCVSLRGRIVLSFKLRPIHGLLRFPIAVKAKASFIHPISIYLFIFFNLLLLSFPFSHLFPSRLPALEVPLRASQDRTWPGPSIELHRYAATPSRRVGGKLGQLRITLYRYQPPLAVYVD
jgi:hypothetical protein